MGFYAISFVAAVVVTIGFWLYRAALPKPIPGIPCMPKSASSILGDIPDALKHNAETSEMISFLIKRGEELKSPILQVFMRPFSRPWVVLLDSREAHDIMSRRTREFDRSEFFVDLFHATLPHNQVLMRTNDQWRFNRKLTGDTMSPGFLNKVAAPQVHKNTLDLVNLWHEKLRLANDRAFDAQKDIQMCTVDTIWAAACGQDIGACKSQSEFLSNLEKLDEGTTPNMVDIPVAPTPEAFNSLKLVAGSSEIPMNSPFGRKHHWFATRFQPTLRRAVAVKDRLVRENIQTAVDRFADSGEASTSRIKSAVDLLVERETLLAKKEGRPADYKSVYLHNELAGFLLAGFETTSTAMSWGLKYLAKHRDVQTKLRTALKGVFHEAWTNEEQPAPEAIGKAHIPYLDAVIDEVLRHSHSTATNIRVAIVDTEILGHHIPKGTDVFFPCSGPSYNAPPMFVDENKRSQSSREFKEDARRWQNKNLNEFDPERWLVHNEDGTIEFDSRAAPMESFGAGIRGCFGKKLGYLEMRIIYTLLLWNFELLAPPEELFDFRGADVITHVPQNVRIRLGYPSRD